MKESASQIAPPITVRQNCRLRLKGEAGRFITLHSYAIACGESDTAKLFLTACRNPRDGLRLGNDHIFRRVVWLIAHVQFHLQQCGAPSIV